MGRVSSEAVQAKRKRFFLMKLAASYFPSTFHAARLVANICRAARIPRSYFVFLLAHRLARDFGTPAAVRKALSMRSA
jgi:hypothetical protein